MAQGWYLPAVVPHADAKPSDMRYFSDRRDALLAAMESIGRDPVGFRVRGPDADRPDAGRPGNRARDGAGRGRRGATHVVFGMPPALGADGVDAVAREVAEPLREELG